MTTFSQWLAGQKDRPDLVGRAGSFWAASARTRPRKSGVEAVTAWLLEHAEDAGLSPEDAKSALSAAAGQYHELNAHVAGVPIEAPPLAPAVPLASVPPPPDGQELPTARDVAERHGWVPPANDPPAIPAAELPIVAAVVQALLPTLTSIDGRLSRIEQWQADQDERIAPIERLLADLGEAEDQADAMDAGVVPGGVAEQAIMTADAHPGPAMSVAPPSGLYGGHVVPAQQAWEDAWQAGEPGA